MRVELNELDLTIPVADLEAELDVIADDSGLAVNVRVRGVWVAQLLLTVNAEAVELAVHDRQAPHPQDLVHLLTLYPFAPSELSRFAAWLRAEMHTKQAEMERLTAAHDLDPTPDNKEQLRRVTLALAEDMRILGKVYELRPTA